MEKDEEEEEWLFLASFSCREETRVRDLLENRREFVVVALPTPRHWFLYVRPRYVADAAIRLQKLVEACAVARIYAYAADGTVASDLFAASGMPCDITDLHLPHAVVLDMWGRQTRNPLRHVSVTEFVALCAQFGHVLMDTSFDANEDERRPLPTPTVQVEKLVRLSPYDWMEVLEKYEGLRSTRLLTDDEPGASPFALLESEATRQHVASISKPQPKPPPPQPFEETAEESEVRTILDDLLALGIKQRPTFDKFDPHERHRCLRCGINFSQRIVWPCGCITLCDTCQADYELTRFAARCPQCTRRYAALERVNDGEW